MALCPSRLLALHTVDLRLLLERAGFEQVVVHGRGNEQTVACYKLLALLLPAVLPQSEPGAMRVRPIDC